MVSTGASLEALLVASGSTCALQCLISVSLVSYVCLTWGLACKALFEPVTRPVHEMQLYPDKGHCMPLGPSVFSSLAFIIPGGKSTCTMLSKEAGMDSISSNRTPSFTPIKGSVGAVWAPMSYAAKLEGTIM